MDLLFLFLLSTLIIRTTYQQIAWDRAKNSLVFCSLVWLLFCLLQIWNPESNSKASWFSSVRGMSLYFFLVSLIVPVIFKRYKQVRVILFVWSILVLLAVLKAWMQKKYGFDEAEWHWLMVRGKGTHLLSTGTRYFSFFTDAANFGTGMSLSAVVFSIMIFFEKKWKIKLFYLIVTLASFYGILLSGTRTALFVTFISYLAFLVIYRDLKVVFFVSIPLLFVFCFLNFTYIGHGNAEIRRMRTAFHKENDSMNVRKENQEVLKKYMKARYFGIGLGLSGGRATEPTHHPKIEEVATDSWFVVLWVETGIVGLLLYLTLMTYCLARGAFIASFKIKNKELRVCLVAFMSVVVGLFIGSYANEIFAQFPNGIVAYTLLAFVFLGPRLDKELANGEAN